MSVRAPGLNEKRCISRHGLGFYAALAASGIYRLHQPVSLADSENDEDVVNIMSAPLAECIEQHPILSILIDGIEDESPTFRKASEIKLTTHIRTLRLSDIDRNLEIQDGGPLDNDKDRDFLISRGLEVIHNEKLEDASVVPPWKVYVLPIPERHHPFRESSKTPTQTGRQVLIVFAYSHAIGDGASGLAFHRTLLSALNKRSSNKSETSTKCKASDKPLPPAIDAPIQLPISWSYFFSAILNAFIPKSVLPKFLQQSPQDANARIWTGAPAFSTDNNNNNNNNGTIAKSATHVFTISLEILKATLSQCRANNSKLSSILHQTIVNALHNELVTRDIKANTFQSSTSIDLRRAHGSETDQMGVMASAIDLTHRPLQPTETEFWTTAQQNTSLLARSASTLQDQQIGLLKYVSSLRTWHTEKIGRERGTTYELSNAMSFEPPERRPLDTSMTMPHDDNDDEDDDSAKTRVEKMIFSQPADVTGPAMSFNVVSLKGGDLTIVVSWQVGALGLNRGIDQTERSTRGLDVAPESERMERAFVAAVATQIQDGMRTVADITQPLQ